MRLSCVQPRLDVDDRLLRVLDRAGIPSLGQGYLIDVEPTHSLSDNFLPEMQRLSSYLKVLLLPTIRHDIFLWLPLVASNHIVQIILELFLLNLILELVRLILQLGDCFLLYLLLLQIDRLLLGAALSLLDVLKLLELHRGAIQACHLGWCAAVEAAAGVALAVVRVAV